MLSYLTLLALALPAPAAGPSPEAPLPGAAADTATYRIDVGHSELTFRIRHLMSRANGTFREWSGTITADPADWSTGSVDVTIQAASIDTRHERRDSDLRSDNFFDVANHPTITFRSTSVEVNGAEIVVTGDLTMKGVSKPISFDLELVGPALDPFGNDRIGLEGSVVVNRKDWGITWNAPLEAGGVLVGEKVTLEFEVSAVRTDS